ncbi:MULTISPECIES: flagellar export chaperone FliS [Pseudomonas]|jgi:flagellar secretion chaperone FliS|uniref:Flagellar secretion chaperone FliS n=1 Tax=Pseudomonas extremaustralis TaxID=359110 RepID=A0A5C5Q8K8_9PSED|nr:flagellar export chaperone FliS [Pseudomonas extremaustralis]EZI24800.1 flagellar biosynthesis protein FliS [Pseudomonas extremaustralis 14-3 substr. 14-3b]MDF3134071.1 flagellar export chaperone FliS [Pseudomonas extremaustralis]TWS00876.1 flagellar export chaperone FliS [Pseudomonas extremaustralis]SDG36798.1 flagellar protein FliS [Pseudomonas extremaustralis]
MSSLRDANAYAKVGVESGILAASPHQRIVMLFDSYQASIRIARLHLQAGHIAEKGQAITKAINIVSQGLRASLDLEQGGEIAVQLDQLYDYVVRVLLRANLNNDDDALTTAAALLENVAAAWRAIGSHIEEER